MKAFLKSTRIAPKKANLVAKMVRGMPVPDALSLLQRTNKKAARLFEALILSASANARSNDHQNPEVLVVKSLIVNKAQAYHRGVPMARGRIRRMRKFLSHISLTLGLPERMNTSKPEQDQKKEVESVTKNDSKKTSQEDKKTVKSSDSKNKTTAKKATSTKKSPTNSKATPSKNSDS